VDLITGQYNWKQASKQHLRIDPSDLRNSGSITRLSREKSNNGGRRSKRSKGLGCSNYTRNLNTSEKNSRNETGIYLGI
jgi:hypothetical protein